MLSKQEFYSLSKQSFVYWKELATLCASLMKFWVYRYSGIVDQSDRKLDCPYAAQAMKYSYQDKEAGKVIDILLKMKLVIDDFIKLLKVE